MNFHRSLKFLFALGFVAAFFPSGSAQAMLIYPGVPHPHIYLVYSGSTRTVEFSATTGLVTKKRVVYLLTDLANPSSFSLLVMGNTPTAANHFTTRVLSADGTSVTTYDDGAVGVSDPADNFFASLTTANPTSLPLNSSAMQGAGVFKYTAVGTDKLKAGTVSHEYPFTVETYATGALQGLQFPPEVVIPTNTVINYSTVNPSASQVVVGGPILDPVPPIGTNPGYHVNPIRVPYMNFVGTTLENARVVPYVTQLCGPSIGYNFDATLLTSPKTSSKALAVATLSGHITLTLNTTLSGLANVGGWYESTPPTVDGPGGVMIMPLAIAIQPVSGPLTPKGNPTVYENFLKQLASFPGGPIASPLNQAKTDAAGD